MEANRQMKTIKAKGFCSVINGKIYVNSVFETKDGFGYYKSLAMKRHPCTITVKIPKKGAKKK